MFECTFELNEKPMSLLTCGAASFPAFSGLGDHVNRRMSACIPGVGPIPPGVYYILDRQSGGLLGPLRDLFTGKDKWFALYKDDESIDDETYCEKIRRGEFRLHPKGSLGQSKGCIVIDKETDFMALRALLKSSKPIEVQGTDLKAYGRLVVR